MKKLVNERLTTEQVQAIVLSEGSKSSRIKQLFEGGLEVGEIAKEMGIIYNFAYNVISNYIIVEDIQDVEMGRRGGKKSSERKNMVMQMLDDGMSVREIAGELKMNMNQIYKIRKENNEQKTEESVAKEA